ncbi:unnamed protein product [Diabrotica balteata]|uniref:glutathione transferase n=1 Tax=Diabrotica balteata TaxID=107213 RepID=A0A9N9TB10_DIABA|nr:unnamed protein product [Diabrotica balteata]
MAPSYKVRYFNTPGRAEPIRMILSYGQIPFEDDRVAREDWPKIKPTTPLGQLPVLEVDGKQIPQSTAICRYLANVTNLAGKDAKENLAIDIAIETFEDLKKPMGEYMRERDESKKQEKFQKLKEVIPFYLGKLEEYANKNGGYIALPRITWPDIVFINIYENLLDGLGSDYMNTYPGLQKVKQNVLSQPGIRDWIKNRPKSEKKYDLKQDL